VNAMSLEGTYPATPPSLSEPLPSPLASAAASACRICSATTELRRLRDTRLARRRPTLPPLPLPPLVLRLREATLEPRRRCSVLRLRGSASLPVVTFGSGAAIVAALVAVVVVLGWLPARSPAGCIKSCAFIVVLRGSTDAVAVEAVRE
jgi:hypothetical protein